MIDINEGRERSMILVAYATRYGSTAEVAEVIADTLSEHGLELDVRTCEEIDTLEGFAAVVLGGPFYLGGWHRDAQRFLAKHRDELIERPVAIFALGPIGVSEQDEIDAPKQLDEELEKHPWLAPVAVEMFGGRFDPSRLSIGHKLLTMLPASPLHGLPATELRDWDGIRSWAAKLAIELQPAVR